MLLGLLLKNNSVSSRRMRGYDLPVVETTGYITLSLRDRGKVNVRITEITELNIMENPVILSKYLKSRLRNFKVTSNQRFTAVAAVLS
jgi:hypothetical protein